MFPRPLSKKPAGAGVQAIAPVVLLNVPAEHGAAEVLPVDGTEEPAGAGVQAVAPVLQRVLTRVPGHGKFRVSGDLHGTLVKSLMC